jgi:UDP-N-acetylglucosamine 2-epimerase (non-hydrolysing)
MQFIVAIGTRPDVIKMRPVINEMRARNMDTKVWWSGQGKDIQDGAVLPVDCDIGHVEWDKGLSAGIGQCIVLFGDYIAQYPEAVVLVHGDDGTAYGAAVGAYLQGNMVAHVEAGLRTYMRTPWPEEGFRRMIAHMASVHLAPDEYAKENLERERVIGHVEVVGNTVVDTIEVGKPTMLVTLHRRENWGYAISSVLDIINLFSSDFDVCVIRHPNWGNHLDLDSLPDLPYCDPMGREEFVERLRNSDVVVTDSGGLQEECALLGIPCYVMRESTERVALKENEAITLCTTPEALNNELSAYFYRRYTYGKPGTVSPKIVDILEKLHE